MGRGATHTPSLAPSWLRIAVHDFGHAPSPARLVVRPGRGLAIVAAIASSWGVDARPDGTTVWARLRRR